MVFCRYFIFLISLCFSSVISGQSQSVILIIGDSISSAYGIERGEGWVSLLSQRLQQQGYPYHVINASISGDTTQNGLYRLPAALEKYSPSIVVLELGGNDGLRGLSLKEMRSNLVKMIEHAQRHKAVVVLIGMRIPPNYGKRYTDAFYDVYVELAEQYNLAFVPFLLESIGGNDGLMQADGLHPAQQAQPIIMNNVWPHLQPLLVR